MYIIQDKLNKSIKHICPLRKSDISSLDFVVNRFFMKLFSICDIYTLQVCQFMFKFMSNALPIQIFQINLNLILTFICITLVSAVICILIPLRLLRDLNPSVIMDRVYGTVCHMKLNLKKTFSTFTRKRKCLLLQLYVWYSYLACLVLCTVHSYSHHYCLKIVLCLYFVFVVGLHCLIW